MHKLQLQLNYKNGGSKNHKKIANLCGLRSNIVGGENTRKTAGNLFGKCMRQTYASNAVVYVTFVNLFENTFAYGNAAHKSRVQIFWGTQKHIPMRTLLACM